MSRFVRLIHDGSTMRLTTFRTGNGTRVGRVEGDEVVELAFSDVGELVASGSNWRQAATGDGTRHERSTLDLAPVVRRPPAIICVGQNYAAHAAEVHAELPSFPTLFAKFTSALLGPNDDLVMPSVSRQVDWEVELAFVVGGRGRYLGEAEAGALIAGYTVANDVSMRDWQGRTSQFLQGKTFEMSTPVGPEFVTADELGGGDPPPLRLWCEVEGERVQDGTTSDLIFRPAAIAAYISQFMALEPGMIVLTGTPGGVGVARTPPVFLAPGQLMRTGIDGIGVLVNRCVPQP